MQVYSFKVVPGLIFLVLILPVVRLEKETEGGESVFKKSVTGDSVVKDGAKV